MKAVCNNDCACSSCIWVGGVLPNHGVYGPYQEWPCSFLCGVQVYLRLKACTLFSGCIPVSMPQVGSPTLDLPRRSIVGEVGRVCPHPGRLASLQHASLCQFGYTGEAIPSQCSAAPSFSTCHHPPASHSRPPAHAWPVLGRATMPHSNAGRHCDPG